MHPERWLLAVGMVALVGGCSGGTASPTSGGIAGSVSYAADVQPIFSEHCAPCHITETDGGLSLASYEGVMTTGEHTPIIDPGRPDTSLLMVVLRAGAMPHDFSELGGGDVQTVADWIGEGAEDN